LRDAQVRGSLGKAAMPRHDHECLQIFENPDELRGAGLTHNAVSLAVIPAKAKIHIWNAASAVCRGAIHCQWHGPSAANCALHPVPIRIPHSSRLVLRSTKTFT
jgi:hypothetical protein